MELDIEEYLPSKKVRKIRESPYHDWYISTGQYINYPEHVQEVSHTPPEFLFTFKQVKSMIERAVKLVRDELNAEYQQELARRLEEKQEQFDHCLETHLNTKLKESQFNYYS